MKIRWLNPDCTEAILERGVWWWKRVAHVRRVGTEGSYRSARWAHAASGIVCLWSTTIEERRDDEQATEREGSNWSRPVDPPVAKATYTARKTT